MRCRWWCARGVGSRGGIWRGLIVSVKEGSKGDSGVARLAALLLLLLPLPLLLLLLPLLLPLPLLADAAGSGAVMGDRYTRLKKVCTCHFAETLESHIEFVLIACKREPTFTIKS